MSDLLEFILNLVFDVGSVFFEDWGGWRFYLPFLGSLGIFGLISWLAPDGALGGVLSWSIVVVGVGSGIVWEVCGGR